MSYNLNINFGKKLTKRKMGKDSASIPQVDVEGQKIPSWVKEIGVLGHTYFGSIYKPLCLLPISLKQTQRPTKDIEIKRKFTK